MNESPFTKDEWPLRQTGTAYAVIFTFPGFAPYVKVAPGILRKGKRKFLNTFVKNYSDNNR